MRIEPAASHRQGDELNLSILSRHAFHRNICLLGHLIVPAPRCPRFRCPRFPFRNPDDRALLIIVHSQIEAQCKTSTNKPKRSKSFTRSTSDSSRVPSRSDSPYGETGQQPKAKTRESSEADASSTNSGPNSGASQATQPPAASEKSMTKKIFGRMSIDKESGGGNAAEQGEKQQHKRTASIMSGRRSSIADDPGSSPSEVRFFSSCLLFSVSPSSHSSHFLSLTTISSAVPCI